MMNPSYWRELNKSRPLLAMAIATIAGILIANRLPQGSLPFTALLVSLILSALLALWKRRWPWFVPLAFALGLFLHTQRLQSTRHHPWHQWLQQRSAPTWVEVEGAIEQPLSRNLPGFEPDEALFRATRITCNGEELPADKSAYFSLMLESGIVLKAGHYRFNGWVQLPWITDNPGGFNKRAYDLRLGLIGQLRIAHVLSAAPFQWNLQSWLIETSESCRAWIINVLSKYLPPDSPETVVLLAMTLGTSDTTTPEMQIPFRLSGTLHIFAVSGLHVAIIGMIFWFLLRCLGVSRGKQPPLLIPLLFFYTFITGLPSSAVRSAVMATVLLLGMTSNRKTDLLNNLGASALLLLCFNTDQVYQAGFQLSFGVLASIALLSNLIHIPLRSWVEPDPFLPKNLLNIRQQAAWKTRNWFAGLISVSAAAWIGSFPLVLYHFHTLTPVGLLANLFLVPWSVIVLSISISRLLLAGIGLAWFQEVLASLSYHAASFTLWMANIFSSLPGGHVYVPSLDALPRPPSQLTVLRMPAGDAANYLRIGSTHWLLDCGSARQFPFTVQPFLHYQGVNQVNHLIISHADSAHYTALPSLEAHYGLRDINAPFPQPKSRLTTPAPHNSTWNLLTTPSLLNLSSDPNLPAKIEVLFPPQAWNRSKADDRTLIARIDIGKFRILWCNDAGFAAEKYLLANHPSEALQCHLIIRNQHEDDFSMLPEFLRTVRPRAIISSNTAFPVEQQIRPALRLECTRLGTLLYDQARSGAVTIKIWPDKLQAIPFRGNLPVLTLPAL